MKTTESTHSVVVRRSIIYVVFAFIVICGVPMFMFTTSIYRAELPTHDVDTRTSQFRDDIAFRVPVYVDIPLADISLHDLESKINVAVAETYNMGSIWQVELKPAGDKELDPKESYVVKLDNLGAGSYSVSPISKEITLHSTETSLTSALGSLLVESLQSIFKEELAAISTIANNKKDANSELVVLYSSTYNVVFNLFVENGKPIDWDIEKAISRIEPVFTLLKHYANFKVSTQIQYYAKLRTEPVYDEERNVNVIKKDDLSTFINFGEWDLNNNDINPSINFLIYFSEGNYKGVPLQIEGSRTNSFLIPQWGGVQIYNTNIVESKVNISESELDKMLAVFVSQLFELLGMPKSPKSLSIRIDSLHRIQTLKNLKISLQNLSSLIKLTNSLNEISIPESTKTHVLEALSFYDDAVQSLEAGDFARSMESSSKSVVSSDKAFFEKEMVQQAYFPNEHKLAVYLPLLGPLCTIATLGLLKSLKQKEKGTDLKEAEKEESKKVV